MRKLLFMLASVVLALSMYNTADARVYGSVTVGIPAAVVVTPVHHGYYRHHYPYYQSYNHPYYRHGYAHRDRYYWRHHRHHHRGW